MQEIPTDLELNISSLEISCNAFERQMNVRNIMLKRAAMILDTYGEAEQSQNIRAAIEDGNKMKALMVELCEGLREFKSSRELKRCDRCTEWHKSADSEGGAGK